MGEKHLNLTHTQVRAALVRSGTQSHFPVDSFQVVEQGK